MALTCVRCRSDLVTALGDDLNLCASCGAHFTLDGRIDNPDDSADEAEAKIKRELSHDG